jgi:hypothetical protein
MKLKLPASVQIKGPSGETIEVSAAQVVEHVTRTGRDLGLSGDVENVRMAARILAALPDGDLADSDLTGLKAALANPARGWVSIPIELDVPVPPGAPPKRVPRSVVPSGIELLPIIDGLLAL